jgi:phosphoribosylformimino-5-aminoimidazole carboxamide ribotide isomerase
VQSRLVAGSEPVALAQALLDAAASRTLYIADLDALQGEAIQERTLHALRDALPGTTFWLDAGYANVASARAAAAALGGVTPVLATEALRVRDDALAGRDDLILSLDRRHGRAIDAAGWHEAPALWPQQVIVMTLDRVGADAGPDLAEFARWQQRSPDTRWIGAGGIRDDDDLAACASAGAYAWLVASALHARRLHRGTALASRPLS